MQMFQTKKWELATQLLHSYLRGSASAHYEFTNSELVNSVGFLAEALLKADEKDALPEPAYLDSLTRQDRLSAYIEDYDKRCAKEKRIYGGGLGDYPPDESLHE